MLFPKDRHNLSDVFVTLGGTIYISFFMIHAPLIASTFYMGDSTSNWIQGFCSPVWLVILTAFGSDIFAYFTGTLIGKHKLCPNLSPKKTVEGLIGGAVGSTLLCGVYGYFFLNDMFIHCLIIGFLGGFVATIGDLSASAIKRHLGVKDYGHLIPGHGGILDRFDSVLFTAPFVFYYFQIHGLITTIIVGGYAYG
jgi:phosphatidate cytidylyltransferase